MKVAMYQCRAETTLEESLQKQIAAIKTAASNGADIVLFPELQLTTFFPQHRHSNPVAISIDDPVVQAIRYECASNSIMAAPNIYVSERGGKYDMTLLIGASGEILGKQSMVHIAQFPNFYEQDYYTPARDGFHVYHTPLGNVGIAVCFDRHYPESIRTLALKGADLILIPTANSSAEPVEMFDWEIRVQAFQNSVGIAMCNRVGIEDNMNFYGGSMLVDADGNPVVAADDEEKMVYGELDISSIRATRSKKHYLDLRRPDLYL